MAIAIKIHYRQDATTPTSIRYGQQTVSFSELQALLALICPQEDVEPQRFYISEAYKGLPEIRMDLQGLPIDDRGADKLEQWLWNLDITFVDDALMEMLDSPEFALKCELEASANGRVHDAVAISEW